MTNTAAGIYDPQTPTVASRTLALNANWTNADVTVTNGSNIGVLSTAQYGYCTGGYWYPYYQVWAGPSRPVRLTMAEVERLRVAAKKDKALRETLEKFTDHIEVIVDFPAK